MGGHGQDASYGGPWPRYLLTSCGTLVQLQWPRKSAISVRLWFRPPVGGINGQ